MNTNDSSYYCIVQGTPRDRVRPVVDHGRCEAKRACVAVCPVDVFEIRRITPEDFDRLRPLGKVRSVAHRRMTAYAVRADSCDGCGLCVTACPDQAIVLASDEVA